MSGREDEADIEKGPVDLFTAEHHATFTFPSLRATLAALQSHPALHQDSAASVKRLLRHFVPRNDGRSAFP